MYHWKSVSMFLTTFTELLKGICLHFRPPLKRWCIKYCKKISKFKRQNNFMGLQQKSRCCYYIIRITHLKIMVWIYFCWSNENDPITIKPTYFRKCFFLYSNVVWLINERIISCNFYSISCRKRRVSRDKRHAKYGIWVSSDIDAGRQTTWYISVLKVATMPM